MVSVDRPQIIETNRSLRLIKNELESLLEKGIINDDAFDTISSLLPAEAPLSGSSRTVTPAASVPTPVSNPPSAALSNLSLNNNSQQPQPPSYSQSTAVPPSLPTRNPSASTVPTKPILAHARAIYKYAATDSRDLSFERDDRIAVHEYMNADWWMGRNTRTGQEGIFPKSYVAPEQENEKSAAPAVIYPAQPQQQYNNPGYNAGYPAAPPQGGEPYNAQQPPHGEEKENKIAEGGKKFGKKLGNAAIFGAGATIGSNIVNSIF
ncbi:SH3 domain-containing protein [Cladorrhinum samala]|uniref:SH3 domain-containing protein n=1 Tax=Cladorrhinum samala TaxID=585594 RepID=A0AAV9I3J6_9PEZI|nr:SH3 domain-containing protein [Cladorrhinum samala]